MEVNPFVGIRAIFFDLDDTLCGYWDASKAGLRRTFETHPVEGISAELAVRAWAKAFRQFAPGLKKTGWYETYLKEGGPTRTEQMRLALKEMGIEDEDLAQRLSETYLNERDSALKLFHDASETLVSLQKRFKLGLITNGPADIQRMEVETLGIGHHFDHILIEGELGRGKPLLEVFRHGEALMGSTPEQTLMVGNSYGHDIRGAINAGWKTIWIRRPSDVPPSHDGYETKPEEMPADGPQPDAIVNDLSQVMALLDFK
ncbi:HAD family hydrolase [soil metagenome]